jgi:hypothetical protein
LNTESTELFIATLAFGLLALATTACVQIVKGKGLSSNFVRLFGLLFVATLAAAITFAGIDSETRTGAYTILGTIAGYLAGSGPITSGREAGGKSGAGGGAQGA